jgi:hypothetical protein
VRFKNYGAVIVPTRAHNPDTRLKAIEALFAKDRRGQFFKCGRLPGRKPPPHDFDNVIDIELLDVVN